MKILRRLAAIVVSAGLLLGLSSGLSLAATTPSAELLSIPSTIRPNDEAVRIKVSYVCTGNHLFQAQVHQPTGIFDANGGEYTGLYSVGGGIPDTGEPVPARCNGKKQTQTLTLYSHDTFFEQLGFEPPSIQAGTATLIVLLEGVNGDISSAQVTVLP